MSDGANNSLKLKNMECKMQDDGNLVTYKYKEDKTLDKVMWSSDTSHLGTDNGPYTLLL